MFLIGVLKNRPALFQYTSYVMQLNFLKCWPKNTNLSATISKKYYFIINCRF